jgi:hypothetical protein
MHKSATKCNETIGKWCKNKHGASKIIDTFETYHKVWSKKVTWQHLLEVAEDFVKTLSLILEINGGFTKVIHRVLLLAV